MTKQHDWIRVHPRDFFNYSTIMRCLGKLAIAILDEQTNDLRLTDESDGLPYEVELDECNGSISVGNYVVYLHGSDEAIVLNLWIPYNSRESYPLKCTIGDGEVLDVLNEDGTFALTFEKLEPLGLSIFNGGQEE